MELIFHNNFVRNTLRFSETGNTIFSPESCSSLFQTTQEGFDEMSRRFMSGNFIWKDEENCSKSLDLYDHKLWKKSKVFIGKEVNLPNETKNSFEKFGCDVELVDVKNAASLNSIKTWINENVGEINSSDLFVKPNINNIMKSNFEWHQSVKVNTSNKKFHKQNETVDADFIDLDGEFGYTEIEDFDAKLIEVPLSNENLKMVFFLPNKKNGLQHLEDRLAGYYWQQQLPTIKQCQMKISVPKFKFRQELNLKDLFYQMNCRQYPYKFGETNSCHVDKMQSITSMEVSETSVKAVALTVCELLLDPLVKEMIYETTIANRFAKTLVTSKVDNSENVAQGYTFSVLLPEDAFITEFVIEIKGKSYKSYIKEKEEAKDIYDKAVSRGRTAAHVAVSARDSNKFTVSVNIEPQTEIKFLLTYEELLQRRYNQYELVLNIQPGSLVNILKVLVKIEEAKKLKFVKTPAIRSGNEISDNEEPNPLSNIETSDSQVTITFELDLENQKEIAHKLGHEKMKGMSGQFVVQYDVELDPSNGEVLISDGYFVHFYVPDDLPPLPKHVVFALDTSGSMGGRKMEQLKDAMKCILDQIKTNDLVDILEFTTNVSVHDIDSQALIVIDYGEEENYQEPFYKYDRITFPAAKPANREMIEKAKDHVGRMRATESTHMIGGLETALFLVKRGREQYSNHQPILIFLTDGMPNVGMSNTNEITNTVTKLNHKNNKVPIFSLSFGEGADKSFLRKLSLAIFGFSRHIYEASDASLQLQQFYKQISSPLLSNVIFKYDSNVEEVTRTTFPIYFRGSDMIVCGRYSGTDMPSTVNLHRCEGCIQLKPIVKKSVTQVERLWAYLTVKQLLEQRENDEDKTELTKKALDLALKYSFVTEVTSLVVVKPEDTSVVNTETASGIDGDFFGSLGIPLLFACSTAAVGGGASYGLRRCNKMVASPRSLPRRACHLKRQAEDGLTFTTCSVKIANKDDEPPFSNDEEVEEEILPEPVLPTELVANYPFLMMMQCKIDDKYVILFMCRISQPV